MDQQDQARAVRDSRRWGNCCKLSRSWHTDRWGRVRAGGRSTARGRWLSGRRGRTRRSSAPSPPGVPPAGRPRLPAGRRQEAPPPPPFPARSGSGGGWSRRSRVVSSGHRTEYRPWLSFAIQDRRSTIRIAPGPAGRRVASSTLRVGGGGNNPYKYSIRCRPDLRGIRLRSIDADPLAHLSAARVTHLRASETDQSIEKAMIRPIQRRHQERIAVRIGLREFGA